MIPGVPVCYGAKHTAYRLDISEDKRFLDIEFTIPRFAKKSREVESGMLLTKEIYRHL